MIDKTQTAPRDKVGSTIGNLHPDTLIEVNLSLATFLGIGTSPRFPPLRIVQHLSIHLIKQTVAASGTLMTAIFATSGMRT